MKFLIYLNKEKKISLENARIITIIIIKLINLETNKINN